MKKEILLYSFMYDFVIASLIKEIEAAKSQGVKLRINTGGGDVLDSYGLVAKLKELPTEPSLFVDGQANSMGAFLCCYFNDVEALDVSEWTFHRAAYPGYIENNTLYFTDDMRAALKKTNDDLRAAMEGKIKPADWKRVTGVSIDDLFSMDGRIDVTITADQALELGLIKKIVKITPERRAEIEKNVHAIAALYSKIPAAASVDPEIKPQIKIAMTIEKLKAEHPELYAAAVNDGVKQERDRVGAYMAFHDVDPEAVATGIQSGEPLTQKAMAELSRKSFSKEALAGAKNENAGAVTTESPDKETPEAEKKTAEFVSSVRTRLGLK